MAAIPRSRPFEGCGNSFCTTGGQQGSGVTRPAFLVEVGGQEPACFVLQQWIHPCHKIARANIAAAKVLFYDVLGRWDKGLMQAFPAFYLRLAANSFGPLVGAGRRITGASILSVFPSNREDIGTPGEQAPKQLDFQYRRRVVVNSGIGKGWLLGFSTVIGNQLLLKRF
ncbi:hypothetical protein PY650_25235 [Rhizobium calliandrae]|uniref:Uncharacterized protein n=1 Tax=Rhizobium calliandrae TaxID=1312182 RepID=A0ABT7KJS4_9HYPH|nr:hypothetical protein [Rhizobium calliandrae]MDL2408883.1 hypothetical protein [Rhizobium calliandrae]